MISVENFYLGLDVGTSACKAVLYTRNAKELWRSRIKYPISRPAPGHAEQSPDEDWWPAVEELVIETSSAARKLGGLISGISVCSQRESVVAVDKQGRSLGSAILWVDKRATSEIRSLRETISEEELYGKTGLVFSPLFVAPKIRWIKERSPRVYNRTYKFLSAKDFINSKLTGNLLATDPTMASRTMLYNIRAGDWDQELISLFRLDASKLPEIRNCYDILGRVDERVARKLGLHDRTIVIAGAGDAQCSVYGMGAVNEGEAVEISGTSSLVEVVTSNDSPPRTKSLLFTRHVLKELRMLEGGVGTSGAILDWYAINFGEAGWPKRPQRGQEEYRSISMALDRRIKIHPSLDDPILLPYFAGSAAKRNPLARGVLYGLTLDHDGRDFIKSILEGVAFTIKEALDACQILGMSVRSVTAIGGGSLSSSWTRIKADVTGRKFVSVGDVEAGCLGGARLLSKANREPLNKIRAPTRGAKHFEPNLRAGRVYEMRYQKFQDIYSALYPIFLCGTGT